VAGPLDSAVVFVRVSLCVGMCHAMHKLMGGTYLDKQTETRQDR
jgi:hypothetical protein